MNKVDKKKLGLFSIILLGFNAIVGSGIFLLPNKAMKLMGPASIFVIIFDAFLAITIALYLDFEKIYLLGFDHDWFKGPVIHFYDEKKEHAMKPTEKKLSFADAEFQMRRHAYIFRKYKCLYSLKKNIFNANSDPEHYMDVFPKVNFDTLFKNKTSEEPV